MSTTRRTAIASGASLAALCSMPAMASINASPDFDLLVLGIQLERLLVERYIPRAKRNYQELQALNAAVEREYRDIEAAGIVLDDDHRSMIRCEVCDRRQDRDNDGESDDFWDEVNGLTGDLCDQILELEPKTFDGLRVHARAISACSAHVWDDDEQTAAFLERACRMLGTSALEADIGRGLGVL
jgi:hypothetical protein